MARDRAELQALLVAMTDNVYFQPPATLQMTYPCIVYERQRALTLFAGNSPYRYTKRYLVTVMDRDPDSPIPDKVAALPMTQHDRYYAVDGLNHDVFDVYF